jgi:hypothetical protein
MQAVFKPLIANPPHSDLPIALREPFDRLPPTLQAALVGCARARGGHRLGGRVSPIGILATGVYRPPARATAGEAHPLGDLPLVVLGAIRTTTGDKKIELEAIKGVSATGTLTIADKSGHEIHLYRPDLMARAVWEVVDAARTKKR